MMKPAGHGKTACILTVTDKEDPGGEMPDPQKLKNKIDNAKRLLQQSY